MWYLSVSRKLWIGPWITDEAGKTSMEDWHLLILQGFTLYDTDTKRGRESYSIAWDYWHHRSCQNEAEENAWIPLEP